MSQATAILGLTTETSLHAGAGSSMGVVDLPIQREGHNGWPCVFGSAVKGALRARAEQPIIDGKGPGMPEETLFAVFGPDTKNASDNAGAISVGDARLLLLPVRSLSDMFRWVTCPESLDRLKRDANRLGLGQDFDFTIPPVQGTQALVLQEPKGTGGLYLEEFRFEQTREPKLEPVVKELAKLMKRDNAKDLLSKRIAVISDEMFTHLTHSAAPVNAHIALKPDTKTVVNGALWYEETLPPETVLYVPLLASASRRKDLEMTAGEVREQVFGLFNDRSFLQLGGNETVGMGWCSVQTLVGGSNQ